MSIASGNEPLVELEGLVVELLDPASGRYEPVLGDVDVRLMPGSALGVTGQSGSGKSTLALALAGLLPSAARVSARLWRANGRTILAPHEVITGRALARRIERRVGRRAFLISQDARGVLLPYRTVGWHLAAARRGRTKAEVEGELAAVGLKRQGNYAARLPQQISTGECQRVQIAMALGMMERPKQESTRRPFLLIADEPFASVELARADSLIGRLRGRVDAGDGVIFISHHLHLLRAATDAMIVMHDGAAVECGATGPTLDPSRAQHAQTRRLLSFEAPPPPRAQAPAGAPSPLIVAEQAAARVGTKRLPLPEISLAAGERLGILGPSGRGKTTLARTLMGLAAPQGGRIERFGAPPWRNDIPRAQQPGLWRRMQMTHQDTDLVFDPAGIIGESLADSFTAHAKADRRQAWRAAEQLLAEFQLPRAALFAPPARLSGGERKRAAIARSLAALGWGLPPPPEERVLILDEPTVGVDLFLQGVLAEALLKAQNEMRLSYLVISHDQRFVERFCTRWQEW